MKGQCFGANKCSQCLPGWEGNNCSAKSCQNYMLCQNNGTCVGSGNSRKCNCTPGYNGTYCETKEIAETTEALPLTTDVELFTTEIETSTITEEDLGTTKAPTTPNNMIYPTTTETTESLETIETTITSINTTYPSIETTLTTETDILDTVSINSSPSKLYTSTETTGAISESVSHKLITTTPILFTTMTDLAESVSIKSSTENEFLIEHYQSKSTYVTNTSRTFMPIKYTTTPMKTHPETSTLQTTYTNHEDGLKIINSTGSNLSTSGYVQTETVENTQIQTSTLQSLLQTSKAVTTTSSTTLVSEESTNNLDIQTQSSTMVHKNTFGHDVFVLLLPRLQKSFQKNRMK
ncbi:Protein slit [Thelohanellus kitauei]|uniref:Protein slit n=1 Tax=Thelohanellus kitauei TaxID=669202 RepID=A0A0C2J7Q8_THEKT|nr:Protein slit [Thelohanellus kitauei]